jgi:hypothetical protein
MQTSRYVLKTCNYIVYFNNTLISIKFSKWLFLVQHPGIWMLQNYMKPFRGLDQVLNMLNKRVYVLCAMRFTFKSINKISCLRCLTRIRYRTWRQNVKGLPTGNERVEQAWVMNLYATKNVRNNTRKLNSAFCDGYINNLKSNLISSFVDSERNDVE